jgi:hypothetical protein
MRSGKPKTTAKSGKRASRSASAFIVIVDELRKSFD